MIESIISSRISHWLEQNSLIPPNIFGFRHQSSTIDRISILVADISYILASSKKNLNAAFLDIQSAFLSVKIRKLLETMNKIGFPDLLTKYIGILFSRLILHFSHRENEFVERTLYQGLPRGSPLSPTLFIIYTLELAQLPIPFKMLLFADNVVIHQFSLFRVKSTFFPTQLQTLSFPLLSKM